MAPRSGHEPAGYLTLASLTVTLSLPHCLLLPRMKDRLSHVLPLTSSGQHPCHRSVLDLVPAVERQIYRDFPKGRGRAIRRPLRSGSEAEEVVPLSDAFFNAQRRKPGLRGSRRSEVVQYSAVT